MIDGLKPYPKYKDSGVAWLGEVPGHWAQPPGKSCYREKKVANAGMRETTVLSLSYGRIVVKPIENLHGLVPASFETYQIIDAGDIIVRPTDLQNDWNSLRFGLSNHRGIITSAYMCLQTTDLMTREYGYSLLHAYDLQKVFYGLGSGLRQNLDWRDFKYLPCLVPPLPEQAAIVRFLDHADRRIRRYIRAKQRLIKLLEEQKQAIIHRAVTRGLDPKVRLKPSGMEWLGDVPEHWEVARLKDAADVQTGLTLGKTYSGMAAQSYPYLRVANVQVGRVDLRQVKRVDVPWKEARGATLRGGDVLMTEGGDIDKLGRGCVWHDEIPGCLHQNHVFAVRCRENRLVPEFLVGMMASQLGRNYFQMTAKQTTNLASTNSTTLRTFPIMLPPIKEQHSVLDEIGDRTSGIERAMDQAKCEISLLREYRTRLIADVVTGKLDVREAALLLPDDPEEPEALDEADSNMEADMPDDLDALPEATDS
jgi:type I restriction enzyme, S subunit